MIDLAITMYLENLYDIVEPSNVNTNLLVNF